MSSKSERARIACLARRSASLVAITSCLQFAVVTTTSAQSAPEADLPPLVVQPATPKKAVPKKKPQAQAAQPTISPAPVPLARKTDDQRAPQDRNDPGTQGFVATQSSVATKTPGTVLTTPRSISTVTKAEIEERNAETVYQALQFSSGVNAYPFSGGFITREQAQVRGFLAYQYLDGLKQHDSNWGIEPYGLERVDVLKGPASMLYGQGSPGGLVAMTSKRPTDEPFTEVVLKAGTHDKLQAGFDFGGPIGGNGALSYRLTGMGRVADGLVDFTDNDRFFIAPAITFRPSNDTSFTLMASYQYDPNMTIQQPLPFAGTVVPGPNGQYISRDLFLGEPGYHDTDKRTLKIGYEFRHRFNETWSIEQNAAYRHIDITLQEMQGSGAVAGTTAARNMFMAEYTIETYQVDTRMRAEFDTGFIKHNLAFGIDYANIPNYQGVALNRTNYFLDLYNPVYGQPMGANPFIQKRYQDFEQAGAYIIDTITAGNLTVVAGLRHDRAKSAQQTQAYSAALGGFTNPPYVPKDDSANTVQLGASYELPGGFAPYVSYSESFFPTPGNNLFGVPFEPTTGEQYEAGIKYQPIGINALFTAAVFDLSQQNVLTADPTTPGNRIQIGEVNSKGFELEGRGSLGNGWSFAGNYTYLDAKTADTKKTPVYLAKHQAALWASYAFDEGALRGVMLGGGVRYLGETNGNAANTFKVPSFTLYDAAVHYDLGVLSNAFDNWRLSLNAKNLTDERYVTNCESLTSCYYGEGRAVDVTLRMRY